ncbi:MAG: hypothetical protein ACD_51C00118G0001, partial [uncultured bacterium]
GYYDSATQSCIYYGDDDDFVYDDNYYGDYDTYDSGCYYDSTGAYVCGDTYDDWGQTDDSWDNYYEPYDYCNSDDYYWDSKWGVDCYCEYGEDYFPDPSNPNSCISYGDTYYDCVNQGMMFDSYTGECVENYYSYDNYDWGQSTDDQWEWNWDDMKEEDEWADWTWDGDDEWYEDELDNMGDMLQEAEYWTEDVEDVEEEAYDWLDEIEWKCEGFDEDYDKLYDVLSDEGRDLFEEAIAFCVKAENKVTALMDDVETLKEEAEEAKADMEDAYENFVSSDDKNPGDFWDVQSKNAINDRRDLLRSRIEMWGRLINFWEFRIEVKRAEKEMGMEAYELGDDIAEQVAYAEYVIDEVETMLSDELPALIEEAEAAIEEGVDGWKAYDMLREFFDETRELMEDDRDMWDALDELWGYAKDMEGEKFAENEMEYLKEDLGYAEEQLDELESEGYEVDTLRDLIQQAWDVIHEMEDLKESGEDVHEEMEELWEELDEIGKQAEKEAEKLGIEDFGPDKKEVYLSTVGDNISDLEALVELLSQVPEDVLEQLIEMLLNKVSTSELEEFLVYSDEFGDIGVFNSKAYGRADEDTLDALINEKLDLLESLSAKIAALEDAIGNLQDKLDEITAKVAGYNWYGDSSDEVENLLAEMTEEIGDASSDTQKEEILNKYDEEFETLKEDAKKDKYDAELIPFKDCDDDQWYTGYVWDVKEDGVVSGYKDSDGNLTGEYGPGDNVTVAETLKIALETAGVGDGDGGYDTSNPYASDHWSESYFGVAEEMDMTVTEDMMQNPDEYASRGEVLQTMFESLGVEVPDYDSTHFSDVDASHEYADAIEYAYELGIVSGDDATGSFRPDDGINRAETAKVVDLFIEMVDEGDLVSESNPQPSPSPSSE